MASIFVMVFTLKKLCPTWMEEENWTFGKEVSLLLLGLLVIALGIWGFILLLDISQISNLLLFQMVVGKTILISIFPILILVLYEQYHYQKKQLQQVVDLNQTLQKKIVETSGKSKNLTANKEIILTTEKGKVVLKLFANEILFLKSDGNYVEIFYTKDAKKYSKKLIRNRLKNLLAVLPKTQFFHCHQRYIVNTQYIIAVNGNARNFELTIRYSDELIPVSRANASLLSNYLKQRTLVSPT